MNKVFTIPKRCSKEEIKRKRKAFFLNIYKNKRREYLSSPDVYKYAELAKAMSKLVSIKVFHKNKRDRLDSRLTLAATKIKEQLRKSEL